MHSEYWSVLFNASQCRDTRGYPNPFWYFPSMINACSVPHRNFPSVSPPLSLPCPALPHSLHSCSEDKELKGLWPPCSREVWEGRKHSSVQGITLVLRNFCSPLRTHEQHPLPATLFSLSWDNFEVLFPCL